MLRVFHPVRLALAPLAIAAIAIATAVPLELRPEVSWDRGFDTLDFLQNLLLYAPLGVALSDRSWRRVVVVAAALSLSAELVQLWSFERFSSPYDVVANVLGAYGGMWLWRRYRGSDHAAAIVVRAFSVVGCVLVSALLYAHWKLPVRSSEISGWDPSFRLLLGNERTGDRPWRGTISSMRILTGALSPRQVRELNSSSWERTADHALFASTVYRNSTAATSNGGPAIALPRSNEIAAQISGAGAFTLLLTLRPADVEQSGPARIVSFSRDTQARNFDLGQEQERLTLRVRTPVSGPNGQDVRADTVPVLRPETEVFVAATYDGAFSRIFVDGQLAGISNLAAAGCAVSTMCRSALPVVWSFFGATIAIVAFALVSERGSRRHVALAIVGSACAAIALPQWSQVVPLWTTSPAWMKLMPLSGALAIGVAALFSAAPAGKRDRRR